MIVNSILFVILFQGEVKYQVNFYFTNPSQNKLVKLVTKIPFRKETTIVFISAESRSQTLVQRSFNIRSTFVRHGTMCFSRG